MVRTALGHRDASSRATDHRHASSSSSFPAADRHCYSLRELYAAAGPPPPQGLLVEVKGLSSLREAGRAVAFLDRMQQEAGWVALNRYELVFIARHASDLELRLRQAVGLQQMLSDARDTAPADAVPGVLASLLTKARASIDKDFPTAHELAEACAARTRANTARRAKAEARRAVVADLLRVPVPEAWPDDGAHHDASRGDLPGADGDEADAPALSNADAARAQAESSRVALAELLRVPIPEAWPDSPDDGDNSRGYLRRADGSRRASDDVDAPSLSNADAAHAQAEASRAALADLFRLPVPDAWPDNPDDGDTPRGDVPGADSSHSANAYVDAPAISNVDASRIAVSGACTGALDDDDAASREVIGYVDAYAERALSKAKVNDARALADVARRAMADALADASRSVRDDSSRALADATNSFIADASRGCSRRPPSMRQALAIDVAAQQLAERAERAKDFGAVLDALVAKINGLLDAPLIVSERFLRLI